MGRNLHSQNLAFFLARLEEHDRVESFDVMDNSDEYLYRICRPLGLPEVRVHLSDAYEYTRGEFLTRPDEIRVRNSFVVLGLPHAHEIAPTMIEEARESGVGLGRIGKFMGALNRRNVWEYETTEERKRARQW